MHQNPDTIKNLKNKQGASDEASLNGNGFRKGHSGRFHGFLLKLNATDLIVITFYLFLTALNLVYYSRVHQWPLLILINFGVISFVSSVAILDDSGRRKFWYQVHYWYLAPMIFLTFKELYVMIKPIRLMDYDYLLINADRFLFGGDPTHFLMKIANPFLTEILQIAYGSFYLLPIILGVNLMMQKRLTALDFSVFSVVYGFFLSYYGYFLLPAIGPRFTLHDFSSLNKELPGLYITNFLREVVNAGESIPAGTPNPAAVVQRDVFPSGHTEMTLIVMYLSYKFRVKSRYFLIPIGTLLIIATVYMRYHYLIDLVGGAAFMIFTMWSGKFIYNYWQKFKGKSEFEYSKF
ncbi:MAG TPA: phosphatase PAP2 family protein [Ignavibacteriales bacterium]|nr:phosphatase PAP2 family protein [Ignavibacteriales bacterium]